MPTLFEGRLVPPADRKIGVIVARFNELITERLLEGALWSFRRHGGMEEMIVVARVPGALSCPSSRSKWRKAANIAPLSVWAR